MAWHRPVSLHQTFWHEAPWLGHVDGESTRPSIMHGVKQGRSKHCSFGLAVSTFSSVAKVNWPSWWKSGQWLWTVMKNNKSSSSSIVMFSEKKNGAVTSKIALLLFWPSSLLECLNAWIRYDYHCHGDVAMGDIAERSNQINMALFSLYVSNPYKESQETMIMITCEERGLLIPATSSKWGSLATFKTLNPRIGLKPHMLN